MSWGEIARLGAEAAQRRREEEKEDPAIIKRWSSIVPTAVNVGVSTMTGSHNAGRAASAATSVAMESSPGFKKATGEFTRDLAHASVMGVASSVLGMILTPVLIVGLPIALIHDALVDSQDKWLK